MAPRIFTSEPPVISSKASKKLADRVQWAPHQTVLLALGSRLGACLPDSGSVSDV